MTTAGSDDGLDPGSGTDPSDSVLEARRDDALARRVAAAAVLGMAVLVGGTLTWLLLPPGDPTGRVVFLLSWLPFVPTIVLATSLWADGDITQLRVETGLLSTVGDDGVVRSLPLCEVGGIGVAGPQLGGRLMAVRLPRGLRGSVVVFAPDGAVMCNRDGGWLRIRDLQALAISAGVPWEGRVPRLRPHTAPRQVRPSWADVEPPSVDRVVAADAARREEAMDVLLVPALARLGVVVGVAGAMAAAVAVRTGLPGVIVLASSVAFGLFVAAPPLGLTEVAVRARTGRWVRRGSRSCSTWQPTEVTVFDGTLPSRSDPRVLVDGGRDGQEQGWWVVRAGGERGWLQGDDRRWVWMARSSNGRAALVAPPGMEALAVLRRVRRPRPLQRRIATSARRAERRWRRRGTAMG